MGKNDELNVWEHVLFSVVREGFVVDSGQGYVELLEYYRKAPQLGSAVQTLEEPILLEVLVVTNALCDNVLGLVVLEVRETIEVIGVGSDHCININAIPSAICVEHFVVEKNEVSPIRLQT